MRNLRNTRDSVWTSPSSLEDRPISATAWDVASDSLILAYGPSEGNSLIELVRIESDFDNE